MVRSLRYLFFFSVLFLMSCTKNEFKLEFDLGADVTENYNVTYYATDSHGGLTIQAVASVREGKCELKGITKKPTLVYITTRKSNFPLVIFAEKGKNLIIKGDNNEPLSWQVGENAINEDLTEWRIENIKCLTANDTDNVNSAVKKYVEQHENNPASFILLECYYDRSRNEDEFVKLMSGINSDVKDLEMVKTVGRTDYLFGTSNNYPARMESMILRSDKASADTIMINGKNPVFLLFWATGNSDKTLSDSIKKILKEYPDTGTLIADVCLDIDSTSWKNAMKRDSLDTKVKRFWVPSGLTDPTMMKLKVNSVPYFIVFDIKGHQSYRGTELAEAMKEYRKLRKTKDSK